MDIPFTGKVVEQIGEAFAKGVSKIFGDVDSPITIPDLPDDGREAVEQLIEFLFTELNITELFARLISEVTRESTSDELAEAFSQLFDNVLTEELAEIFGRVIITPFISLMERYADEDFGNAEDFAAAFHGLSILLTLPEFAASALQGHGIATFIGPIAAAFKSIYWNLGLGFLGWQTLAPLLSQGLQPRLERHYAAKYRPARFDLKTLMYLTAVDKIPLQQLGKEAREQGWRDRDVLNAIDLSYKVLSRSDIKKLMSAGRLTEQDATDNLLRAGYRPEHAEYILTDILNEDIEDERSASLGTIRRAYKSQLISTREFRELLSQAGYSAAAITLEIRIASFELQAKRRELSQAQVRARFIRGLVNATEVFGYLKGQGYDDNDAREILELWGAEKAPRILKLNQGTITKALRNNVITQAKASSLLASIGHPPENVDIIIRTTLSTGGGAVRQASLGRLMSGLTIGALTAGEFDERVRNLGYGENDIRLFRRIAVYERVQDMTVRDVEQAVRGGVIGRETGRKHLTTLGVEPDAIALRLDTWVAAYEDNRPKASPAVLVLAYKQGIIEVNGLQRGLAALGLGDDDIRIMVASAQETLPREASSSEVRQLYYTKVIDKNRAIDLLVKTGLTREISVQIIESYDRIIDASSPTPSVSQYIAAFQNDIISEAELVDSLRELGFGPQAIAFYVEIAKSTEYEVTRELTKADILGLFKDELLRYEEALEMLIELGYSVENAELLLERRRPGILGSQVHRLFMSGVISPEEMPDVLVSLGYTVEQISEYLQEI